MARLNAAITEGLRNDQLKKQANQSSSSGNSVRSPIKPEAPGSKPVATNRPRIGAYTTTPTTTTTTLGTIKILLTLNSKFSINHTVPIKHTG